MRKLIGLIFLPFVISSCSVNDYSKDIIGKWECVEMEIEFEGVQDPHKEVMYDSFKNNIEFKENNSCTEFIGRKKTEGEKKFNIGGIWSGDHSYVLNDSQLIIDNKWSFTIKSIENNIMRMDWHLTLKQTQFNYGRLNKLRKMGVGENVTIHYTFRRYTDN